MTMLFGRKCMSATLLFSIASYSAADTFFDRECFVLDVAHSQDIRGFQGEELVRFHSCFTFTLIATRFFHRMLGGAEDMS